MLAGQDDPEDIIRSVPRGLYAKHFGGGQVDITSGKFVFSATEAYLIEDGKVGPPVVGRHPDRQRAGHPHQGHAHRPRPAARRRRRRLLEGRAERARGRGPAHDPGLRDHGRRHAGLARPASGGPTCGCAPRPRPGCWRPPRLPRLRADGRAGPHDASLHASRGARTTLGHPRAHAGGAPGGLRGRGGRTHLRGGWVPRGTAARPTPWSRTTRPPTAGPWPPRCPRA